MLTSIREKATGWIAWAIVILITIPFALWGVNSYFTGGMNVNVAEFDGEEIDYETYQRALYSERERVRQIYGSNASAELLSGEILGRQVVNRLVNDTLLVRAAHEQGYRISDEQLAQAIRVAPGFQTEDGFSRELYERVLRFSGFSPTEFEAVQRNNAATQQLQTGFIESSLPIEAMVEDALELLHQRRVGEYVIVEAAAYLADIQVTDAQIMAEYESNENLYIDDEAVKVEYLELSIDDFASNYTPTEQTLREIYDSQAQQYREEERRSVSHILLEGEAEDNTTAIEEAQSLVARLRGGEDFAGLAAEYSADVGSASQGGSLGWINRGATVPAFESVAFSLAENEISDPVESEFGVHIIRVDQIQAERFKSFEEVRAALTQQAIQTQAESEMFELAEEVRNIAFEQPDSLDPAGDLLGQSVQVSDWFSRAGGTGIAASVSVRQAAFDEAVLHDGFNSDVVSLDDGRHVVLRKLDYRPAAPLSLDLVKDEITEKLLAAKGAEQAQQFGESLIEQLNNGADWNETINNHGLTPASISVRTGDDGDRESAEVAAYVYAWEKPANGGIVYGSGPISNGRYAVFSISGVVAGDLATATDQERDELRNIMQLRYGLGLFESYLVQLRSDVEVSVNEELL